ncbi:hypothetical protein EYR40_010958 [Pleurotus pulmonarius]|nr:hypothetical protein EYR36_002726 [Pleurotus pulmonarius]KAF4586941.1 hypothetical protein EYR40_010958 [Pleurotus pulmonarius]
MTEYLPPLGDDLDVMHGFNNIESFEYLTESPSVLLQDLNPINERRSTLEPVENTILPSDIKPDGACYLAPPPKIQSVSWPFKQSPQFSLLYENNSAEAYGDGNLMASQEYLTGPAEEAGLEASFLVGLALEPTTPELLAATAHAATITDVAPRDTWGCDHAGILECPTAPPESILPANEADKGASAFLGEFQLPVESGEVTTPDPIQVHAATPTDPVVHLENDVHSATVDEQSASQVSPIVPDATYPRANAIPLAHLAVCLLSPDYKNMRLPVSVSVPSQYLHPRHPPPDYRVTATMDFPLWSSHPIPPHAVFYDPSEHQPSTTTTALGVNAATNHSGCIGWANSLPSDPHVLAEPSIVGPGNSSRSVPRPTVRGHPRSGRNRPNPYPSSSGYVVDDPSSMVAPTTTPGNPYPTSSGYVEGHPLAAPVQPLAPVKVTARARRVAPLPSRAPRHAAHRPTSSSASSSQSGSTANDDYEGTPTVGKKRKASSKGQEPERRVQHRYEHPKMPGDYVLITKSPTMYIENGKGIVEELIAQAGPSQIRFL